MKELHDWLFHYNPYTELWAAFKRDHLVEYFNGDFNNIIRSKSQKTLEELIIAYSGDLIKINKVVSKSK